MIFNKTKKKVIAEVYKVYAGIFQAKGLMFTKKRAAFFPFSKPRRISIHTMFVFYPIDIILLDEKSKVIEKKEDIAPYSFYRSTEAAKSMIELPSPAGKSISKGDIITFK